MRRFLLLSLPALLFVSAAVAAGPPTKQSGIGVIYAIPSGEMEKAYQKGYGAAYTSTTKWGWISMTTEGAWTHFAPKDGADSLGAKSINTFSGTIGPTVWLGPLYVGAEGGYFTDVHEWDLVAAGGLDFRKFNVGIRYKALGKINWISARLLYMF